MNYFDKSFDTIHFKFADYPMQFITELLYIIIFWCKTTLGYSGIIQSGIIQVP